MPQIPRLKKRFEFTRIAATRQKSVTKGVILQVREHQNRTDEKADPFRIGFTVSKKVGNAVERNRAKRRLRAAAEEILQKHAPDGYDFVAIGRRTTLDRPWKDLLGDFRYALKKLGLRDGKPEDASGVVPKR